MREINDVLSLWVGLRERCETMRGNTQDDMDETPTYTNVSM